MGGWVYEMGGHRLLILFFLPYVQDIFLCLCTDCEIRQR